MKQLSRPVRRATLVVHVAASVSWLGLTLGLLALGIAGANAGPASSGGSAGSAGWAGSRGSDGLATGAYLAMQLFVDWLIIPLALTTLASGLVLSLGTPWGLARYRWVITKFWLTLAATIATGLALRAEVGHAAQAAAAGRPLPPGVDLVVPPSVALTLYVFVTTISILKPWGLTARGRRWRAEKGRAQQARAQQARAQQARAQRARAPQQAAQAVSAPGRRGPA